MITKFRTHLADRLAHAAYQRDCRIGALIQRTKHDTPGMTHTEADELVRSWSSTKLQAAIVDLQYALADLIRP